MTETILRSFGQSTEPLLIVHGGAGHRSTPLTSDGTASAHALRKFSKQATSTQRGGSAVDAVVAAVRELEDAPDFNVATGPHSPRQEPLNSTPIMAATVARGRHR